MSADKNTRDSAGSQTERQFRSSSSSNGPSTFDINIYQQKKTLAEGMMDIALMSANANQLRYVLSSKHDIYRWVLLFLISSSFVLQVAVGIGLILNIKYDVNQDEQMCKANQANNWTIIGIFLVTVLNVAISSFGASQV